MIAGIDRGQQQRYSAGGDDGIDVRAPRADLGGRPGARVGV